MDFKIFKLAIWIVINSISLSAQKVELSLDNPYPRVNQMICIKFQLDFLTDYLTEQLGQKFIVNPAINSPYSILVTTKDTGEVKLGPFEITINNIKYKSDSLKINVLKALQPIDSVYIWTFINKSKQYIVIEQVYELKINPGENYYANKPKLVSFNNKDYGLIIFTEKNSFDDLFKSKTSKPLHYSYKLYEVTKVTDKRIKIINDNFDNLPGNYLLPEIILE